MAMPTFNKWHQLCYLFVLLNLGLCQEINIYAPSYARVNELIELQCTASQVPRIRSAEFLKNGRTLTNIEIRSDICFTTLTGDICQKSSCCCSEDGKTYRFVYQATNNEKENVFACKMTFSNMGKLSSNVSVQIFDPPILTLQDKFTCNLTTVATMVCRLHGGSPNFTFVNWKHMFNGVLVRSLEGFVVNRLSVLQAGRCNYENAGKYVCTVHNSFTDGLISEIKTATLVVEEPPVILNKTVFHLNEDVIFLTIVYSSSDIISTIWYDKSNNMQYQSQCVNSSRIIPVALDIYEKTIETDGFEYKLICRHGKPLQQVDMICIKNAFGQVCDEFHYRKVADVKESRDLFWIMIGAAITTLAIVLFIIITVTIVTRRNRKGGDVGVDIQTNVQQELPTRYLQRNNSELVVLPYESPVVESFHISVQVNEDTSMYLDVKPDEDSSSKNSDHYEQVD